VASTRERIVDAGSGLFRKQGYNGTGVKQIVAEANAPFGSLYHFFPGGKTELGEEVIRSSGAMYIELFATIAAQAPDVLSAVGEFFSGAADTLRETNYEDACPIATVALEVASTNEPLRKATADVFDSWIEGATEYFVWAGIDRSRARELALTMLSLLEGAFVFSRALRSTEPVLVAGAAAVAEVRGALRDGAPGSGGAAPPAPGVTGSTGASGSTGGETT
jgi:AcrR family transcriptional regulator